MEYRIDKQIVRAPFVGKTVLTFEQMQTLITQISAVVNSQALCYTLDTDLTYLSPAHFLIGRPFTTIPEGDLTHLPINRLDYWQHLQSMCQGCIPTATLKVEQQGTKHRSRQCSPRQGLNSTGEMTRPITELAVLPNSETMFQGGPGC